MFCGRRAFAALYAIFGGLLCRKILIDLSNNKYNAPERFEMLRGKVSVSGSVFSRGGCPFVYRF